MKVVKESNFLITIFPHFNLDSLDEIKFKHAFTSSVSLLTFLIITVPLQAICRPSRCDFRVHPFDSRIAC